jgi:hypothetical protein
MLQISQPGELFGVPLIDTHAFFELLLRFLFNFAATFLVVRYIYYPKTHRRDYLFTFILIGVVIFLMCYLLESVKLQLGFALGLFAVFGIIRYRTLSIPIKEMTYLFVVIGLSVINALSNKKISYAELLFANIVIFAITYFIERIKSIANESYTVVLYEKIELVNPDRKEELIADLEARLGMKISRISITNINYQKDTAKILVYFMKNNQSWGSHEDIDYRTITNE